MTHVIPFLLAHGYVVIFISVMVELLGLPTSSVPLFIAAGALAGSGRLSLLRLLVLSVSACLMADMAWYQLGRRRGYSILKFLCRISLEPDSCVRRTQDRFTRQGGRTLLVAKFIPGLGTAAAPLAGLLRMKPVRFLSWDAAGSLLWSGTYLLAGYFFSPQLDRLGAYASRLGTGLVILLAAAIAAYLMWKYRQRRRFIRDLRIARITPEALYGKMAAGEEVVVVDLRGSVEFEAEPGRVRGAIHMGPNELEERHAEIPRDRDVVLYCT
jgi:membrane protein DedA with SNARE-associated domain